MLGAAAKAGVRLIVWCKHSQHQTEPDPAEQSSGVAQKRVLSIGAIAWFVCNALPEILIGGDRDASKGMNTSRVMRLQIQCPVRTNPAPLTRDARTLLCRQPLILEEHAPHRGSYVKSYTLATRSPLSKSSLNRCAGAPGRRSSRPR